MAAAAASRQADLSVLGRARLPVVFALPSNLCHRRPPRVSSGDGGVEPYQKSSQAGRETPNSSGIQCASCPDPFICIFSAINSDLRIRSRFRSPHPGLRTLGNLRFARSSCLSPRLVRERCLVCSVGLSLNLNRFSAETGSLVVSAFRPALRHRGHGVAHHIAVAALRLHSWTS